MTLLDSLVSQGVRAFREPREAAADVVALGVPREVLVPAAVAVVILGVLANALGALLVSAPESPISHFQTAVFMLVVFFGFAVAVYKVGELLGGIGTWQNSLLLATFFQAMFLPVTALQVFLVIISPQFADVFSWGAILFGLWVNVNFVAALHGFPSLWKALGVLLLASIVGAFIMAFAAPLIGISLFGGVPNV